MKKIKNILLTLILCFALAGCGFVEEESTGGIGIESIKTIEVDGITKMVITYTDPERTPDIFTLPSGSRGNGIKDLVVTDNETNDGKTITITYTANDIPPSVFEIKNGVSILGIKTEKDEDENTILYVELSDGTTSEGIIIPPGKDGENGISVVNISQIINRDKSVTIKFEMSEGEPYDIIIPAPQQGKDGKGISSVVIEPSDDTYKMIITYDDENPTQEIVEFARPNKWYSESGLPTDDLGINGDLWYDVSHNIIFVKQNNKWSQVINLGEANANTCTIKFDLNDSLESPASMVPGTLLNYEIEEGKYFEASGYDIPYPTRAGYEFMGWYTSKNPNITHGVFNNLTVVMNDLTLYASWKLISE